MRGLTAPVVEFELGCLSPPPRFSRCSGWVALLLLLCWAIENTDGAAGSAAPPSSSSVTATTAGGTVIPIIDISPWTHRARHSDAERQWTVDAVARACREIGFFAVRGHGCSSATIDRAWSEAAAFFDLPAEEKLKSQTTDVSAYPYGYERSSERLSAGKRHGREQQQQQSSQQRPPPPSADLKETFSIGPSNPDSGMPARRWPAQPPQLAGALSEYYREMEALALTVLQIFAAALQLPTATWFADNHVMDRHMSALRVLNYFPVNLDQVPDGAIRAGAHTDYGALTILKSGGPGLQVKRDAADGDDNNNNNDGSDDDDGWIDVPTLKDAFVINIGDMMQRWTNDQWVSTLHRVVLKTSDNNNDTNNTNKTAATTTKRIIERRQSIAFFCNMNHDAVVEPIPSCVDEDHPSKYEPVTAGKYLLDKHYASMNSSPNGADADGTTTNEEL